MKNKTRNALAGCMLMMAAMGAQAANVLQIGCNTNTKLFNTGFDAVSGGKLTTGIDPTWEATDIQAAAAIPSTPPASLVFHDAHVGRLAGAWNLSPYGASEWISRETSTSATGVWYYRVRFALQPTVIATSFSLGMDFMADNSVAEIYVNGVRQSPAMPTVLPQGGGAYNYPGFVIGSRAAVTLTGPWNPAGVENSIVVRIHSGAPYEGFLAEVQPNAVCPPAQPQIVVTKTASVTSAVPTAPVSYTITVANGGTAAANGTVVSDPLPAGLSNASWTCSGANGATCGAPSGTGSLLDTIAALPVDSSVTYTVSATMGAGAAGPVVNRASATPPAGSNSLCAPAGTAPPCVADAAVQRVQAEVVVDKTASVSSAMPGEPVSYVINVANNGTAPADGTVISDPLPAGLSNASWTCSGSNGAVCGAASATGNLQDTATALPVGGALSYVVNATMGAGAAGAVVNSASATPPAGSVCAATGTPPPCVANASVQRTLLPVPPSAQAVPALGEWALACLALVLSLVAGWRMRRMQ